MPEALREIGRYEVIREVGHGGMATVYLARQTDLGREVALKELSAFHARDPMVAERFLRESRVAASLTHPNIVTVHDYFQQDGTPYIAMEYMDRGSLRPYVKRLTPAQIFGVLEGVLAGLARAEGSGVVHRDLKPENLLVDADGGIKIADFGIAKAERAIGGGATLTATGSTVGTPTYMAPEQAMARDIGPWTDLYSVGVMAYEMLAGKLPFPAEEAPMAVLLHHINDPVPPLRSVDPRIDPGMAEWVERLLVKEPSERPGNAQAAWDELEGIVIDALGARWRRKARLLSRAEAVDTPDPLTPAPFESTHLTPTPEPGAAVSESSAFLTFHPGSAEPEEAAASDGRAQAVEAEPAEGVEEAPAEHAAPPEPVAEAPAAPPEEAKPEPVADPGATIPPVRAPTPEPTPTPPPAPKTRRAPAAPPPTPTRRKRGAAPPPTRERAGSGAGIATPDEAVAPAAPTPARRRGGEGLRRLRIPAAVAAFGLLAAGGFLLAPSSGTTSEAPEPLTGSASSGAAQLEFPASFARTNELPEIRGLELSDPVALARAGATPLTIAAGISDASGPTLLPGGPLRQAAAEREPEAVELGELQAFRYDELPVGDQVARIYAAPTTVGVMTVVCAAPTPSATAAAPACDRIAATVQPLAGEALPLGPSEEYADALGGALGELGEARSEGRDELDDARLPGQQATAAAGIASAYGDAATALGKLEVGPREGPAHGAIIGALRRAGSAYSGLASAARKGNRSGYGKATAKVTAGERGVERALAALGELGYELGSESN